MNWRAIAAIYRFEMARFFRTVTQSIVSPVLSTVLYFVVFGSAIGGRCCVNSSGGLIGQGHPLGPTGLGQVHELTRQLRGTAGTTQVEGATTALQHNLGLGGACVTTLYQRV